MLCKSAVLLCVVVLSIIVEPRSAVLFNPNAENKVAIGAAIVLMAALSNACVQIQISRLVRNEHLAVIIFYFAATSTAVAALMSLFGWVALSHLNALLLRPLYSSILFLLIIGYAVFGETPSLQMLIGVSIFITAGFIMVSRSAQLGIEWAKTRAMNQITDLAMPSNYREDASDGVDKDQVGTV